MRPFPAPEAWQGVARAAVAQWRSRILVTARRFQIVTPHFAWGLYKAEHGAARSSSSPFFSAPLGSLLVALRCLCPSLAFHLLLVCYCGTYFFLKPSAERTLPQAPAK